MILDRLAPGIGIGDAVRAVVLDIEFSEALLNWMLGLLLFAGALRVRGDLLRGPGLGSAERRNGPQGLSAPMGLSVDRKLAGSLHAERVHIVVLLFEHLDSHLPDVGV